MKRVALLFGLGLLVLTAWFAGRTLIERPPRSVKVAEWQLRPEVTLSIYAQRSSPEFEDSIAAMAYDIEHNGASVMNGAHLFGGADRRKIEHLSFRLLHETNTDIFAVVEASRSNVARIVFDAETGWNWPARERSTNDWNSYYLETLARLSPFRDGGSELILDGRMGDLMP